jgi:hypothetical protein
MVQGLAQSLVQVLTFQDPKIHQLFVNFLSLNDKINTKYVFLPLLNPWALKYGSNWPRLCMILILWAQKAF